MPDRRRFIALVLGALGSAFPGSGPLFALGRRLPRSSHPTPRPGITSAKVLTAEQLADSPQVTKSLISLLASGPPLQAKE